MIPSAAAPVTLPFKLFYIFQNFIPCLFHPEWNETKLSQVVVDKTLLHDHKLNKLLLFLRENHHGSDDFVRKFFLFSLTLYVSNEIITYFVVLVMNEPNIIGLFGRMKSFLKMIVLFSLINSHSCDTLQLTMFILLCVSTGLVERLLFFCQLIMAR
jgi:hypothetical protein